MVSPAQTYHSERFRVKHKRASIPEIGQTVYRQWRERPLHLGSLECPRREYPYHQAIPYFNTVESTTEETGTIYYLQRTYRNKA